MLYNEKSAAKFSGKEKHNYQSQAITEIKAHTGATNNDGGEKERAQISAAARSSSLANNIIMANVTDSTDITEARYSSNAGIQINGNVIDHGSQDTTENIQPNIQRHL